MTLPYPIHLAYSNKTLETGGQPPHDGGMDDIPTRVALLEHISKETVDTLKEIRSEMRGEFKDLRSEMRESLHGIRSEARESLHSLRSEMHDGFKEIRAESQDMRSVHDRDFRITFGALIAVALGLAGMMAKGFHWL